MKTYVPQVMLDAHATPYIVFAHGRIRYHAVTANGSIKIVTLDSLRGLLPATRKDEPYSPKRAASYWLNHSTQLITPRARMVLRSLVKRDPQP